MKAHLACKEAVPISRLSLRCFSCESCQVLGPISSMACIRVEGACDDS